MILPKLSVFKGKSSAALVFRKPRMKGASAKPHTPGSRVVYFIVYVWVQSTMIERVTVHHPNNYNAKNGDQA